MALLARARSRTHLKHGGFALILSSAVEKWLLLNNEHGDPIFFSIHCNRWWSAVSDQDGRVKQRIYLILIIIYFLLTFIISYTTRPD